MARFAKELVICGIIDLERGVIAEETDEGIVERQLRDILECWDGVPGVEISIRSAGEWR